MSELERSGLVHSERTSGRFITEDGHMIEKMREDLAAAQIKEFMEKMNQMGFKKEEILKLIQKTLEEGKKMSTILECRGLSKRYGQKLALDHVELTLNPEESSVCSVRMEAERRL